MARSYRTINYTLRPAKCIERKMICDTLARLVHFAPMHDYRYVGFGSIYFCDFQLLHKTLGIIDMTSIEKHEGDRARFEFNVPFRCVRVVFGASNSVLLNVLKDHRPTILWLDYDGKLCRECIVDIQTFLALCKPGDALIVTVNAQCDASQSTDEGGKPLDELRNLVGLEWVPLGVSKGDLGGWGTARVCWQIIRNVIESRLSEVDGAVACEKRKVFEQLLHFNYSDGSKMLTVGGVISDGEHSGTLDRCCFDDLEFIRRSNNAFRIEVPNLTYKELRHLSGQMPSGQGAQPQTQGIPPGDLDKYARIYRYFPNYAETDT